jgi:WD40 repeat protein
MQTPGKQSYYNLAFHPKEKLLASSDLDVWETLTGKLVRSLEGHTSVIDWAEFSPDGQLLGSKSDDNTFRLWRCDTWVPVAIVPEAKNHDRPVRG